MRIDIHTHAYSAHTAPRVIDSLVAHAARNCPGFHVHGDGTVPDLVRAEAEAGIDRFAICPVATRPEQHTYMTRFLAALRSGALGEEAARRVIPCVSLHPDDADAEAHLRTLARLGARLVKLHPYAQRAAIDSPRMIRLLKIVAAAGLPVLCHTGHDISALTDAPLASPIQIIRAHRRVRGLRLICAHCASWKNEASAHLLLGRDIYVDLAFQPDTGVEPIVRRFAAEHRADRILFGSDWPWASPAEHAARIAAWGLPPERLDAILGGNARQLLEL